MKTKLPHWLIALVCLLIFWCVATSRADLNLNISLSDTNALVTWTNTGVALQTAPALDGDWNDVTDAASPYSVPATNTAQYFRLRQAAGATTLPATQVASRSAVLNGADTPTGNNTLYWFEYGTDTSYGETTPQTPLDTSTNLTSLNALVSDVTALTDYHFQLVVADDSGTNYGGDQMFTTPADPVPIVNTLPAAPVGAIRATLNGNINPGGPGTDNAYFEYGPDVNHLTVSTYFFPEGNYPRNISFTTPTNLTPNTTYVYRFSAYNNTQAAYGAFTNFTTGPLPVPPTLVGPGTVSDLNAPVVISLSPGFFWNPTSGAASYTLSIEQYPSGNGFTSVAGLTGTNYSFGNVLLTGTTYKWSVSANDSLGDQSGASEAFYFTMPGAPTVQTLGATNINVSRVDLEALVYPNGLPTAVYYDLGTTTNYGKSAAGFISTALTTTQIVVVPAYGTLISHTIYHYRMSAENVVGGGKSMVPTPHSRFRNSDTCGNDTIKYIIVNPPPGIYFRLKQ